MRPLFRELLRTVEGRPVALALYAEHAKAYHPICAKMVGVDIEKEGGKTPVSPTTMARRGGVAPRTVSGRDGRGVAAPVRRLHTHAAAAPTPAAAATPAAYAPHTPPNPACISKEPAVPAPEASGAPPAAAVTAEPVAAESAAVAVAAEPVVVAAPAAPAVAAAPAPAAAAVAAASADPGEEEEEEEEVAGDDEDGAEEADGEDGTPGVTAARGAMGRRVARRRKPTVRIVREGDAGVVIPAGVAAGAAVGVTAATAPAPAPAPLVAATSSTGSARTASSSTALSPARRGRGVGAGAAAVEDDDDDYAASLAQREVLLRVVEEHKAGATLPAAVKKVKGPLAAGGEEEEEGAAGGGGARTLADRGRAVVAAVASLPVPSGAAPVLQGTLVVAILGGVAAASIWYLRRPRA